MGYGDGVDGPNQHRFDHQPDACDHSEHRSTPHRQGRIETPTALTVGGRDGPHGGAKPSIPLADWRGDGVAGPARVRRP